MTSNPVRLMQLLEGQYKRLVETAAMFYDARLTEEYTHRQEGEEAAKANFLARVDATVFGYVFQQDEDGTKQFAAEAGADWDAFIATHRCAKLLTRMRRTVNTGTYHREAILAMVGGAHLATADEITKQLRHDLKES
jgi:hypothetical protein